jgi:hypothetical protein
LTHRRNASSSLSHPAGQWNHLLVGLSTELARSAGVLKSQGNLTVSSSFLPAGSSTTSSIRAVYTFRAVVPKPAGVEPYIVRYVSDAQSLSEQLLNEKKLFQVPRVVGSPGKSSARRTEKATVLPKTDGFRLNSQESCCFLDRIIGLNFNQIDTSK